MTAYSSPCSFKSAVPVKKLAAVLFFVASVALPGSAFAQKWQDLKPDEQRVLASLQPDWQSLSDVRKRKWREIASKYQKMTPDQQNNLQDRMAGWAKLSADERRKAREQYNELKQLPPQKRATVPQKWDEYRNLPPEKREELRNKAVETKPGPTGRLTKPGALSAPAPASTADAKKP